MKIRPVGAQLFYAVTKVIIAFLNFEKAPKCEPLNVV
jgi:hypothetical protein